MRTSTIGGPDEAEDGDDELDKDVEREEQEADDDSGDGERTQTVAEDTNALEEGTTLAVTAYIAPPSNCPLMVTMIAPSHTTMNTI